MEKKKQNFEQEMKKKDSEHKQEIKKLATTNTWKLIMQLVGYALGGTGLFYLILSNIL